METKTETQLIKINAAEYGIEQSKANDILSAFEPSQIKMAELEPEYLEVIDLSLEDPMTELKTAELIKKYVKVRTGRDSVHKNEKAFYLNAGRFVDAIKKAGNAETEKREEKLESIKNHFLNIEKERIQKLADSRCGLLKQFDFDGSTMNLGSMDENVWVSFLAGTELTYKNRIAEEKRVAEEKVAREKAEGEERERIAKENIKLKAEAEAKEKQIADERAAAKKELDKKEAIRLAEQKKADDLLETQRKESEAKAKKEKEISDAKLKAEREAKEKVEAELKAKQDAEHKAQEAKQAEIKAQKEAEVKAAKAPEKEKIKKWLDSMQPPFIEIGTFKHDTILVLNDVHAKFEAFKKWANEQINTL